MKLKTLRTSLVILIGGLPILGLLSIWLLSQTYGIVMFIAFIVLVPLHYAKCRKICLTQMRNYAKMNSKVPVAILLVINECANDIGITKPNVVMTKGAQVFISSLNNLSVLCIGEKFNISSLTTEELRSMTLHEFGHVVMGTANTKILSWVLVKVMICLTLATLCFSLIPYENLKNEEYILVVQIVTIMAGIYSQAKWLRTEEYLCDEFAVEKLGPSARKNLLSALLKYQYSDIEWIPPHIVKERSSAFALHPSLVERGRKLGASFIYSGHGYYTLQM